MSNAVAARRIRPFALLGLPNSTLWQVVSETGTRTLPMSRVRAERVLRALRKAEAASPLGLAR